MTFEKISAPGVYDIPADVYHSDCCVEPALSSGGAREIVAVCPASFWHSSPMNPAYVREEKNSFDIGTAGHLVMLEPHLFAARTVIVPFDDYKTKAARELRDQAYADGKVPLKPEEAARLAVMRTALLAHPIAAAAFTGGEPERSYIWRDESSGVMCKARPDYVREGGRVLVDYKTAGSAHPRDFRRAVWDHGYHQQAPWYMDGVEAITGRRPEEFWFVVQEKAEPHLISVCKLDPSAIAWGELANRRARSVFAECCRTGYWPGYREPNASRDRAFTVSLPSYAEFELEERKLFGEFGPPKITDATAQMADRFNRPLDWDE